MDLYASVCMVVGLMLVPETGMILFSALSSVLLFEWQFDNVSVNMSWTAVSFLLAFPLQNSIRSAYHRREAAVAILSEFRALLASVVTANVRWSWPGAKGYNGRLELEAAKKKGYQALPAEHTERVRQLVMRVVDALHAFLLVPRGGRPRHEYCRSGKEEKCQIEDSEEAGRHAILQLLRRLQGATEELKRAGLPPNEASRINQYNMQLVDAFERLWSIKTYRTPMGLRAIVRVFVQVLPFFYGPYWVCIARGETGIVSASSLVFACLFSSMISLVLVAMINFAGQIENPFQPGSPDAVRVEQEMDLLRDGVAEAIRDLEKEWFEKTMYDWEMVEDEEDEPSSRSAASPCLLTPDADDSCGSLLEGI